MISHAVFFGDDGDDGGFAEHAFFVFGLEDFDEFVRDAAEAAGENDALGVFAGDQTLQSRRGRRRRKCPRWWRPSWTGRSRPTIAGFLARSRR